MTLNHGPMQTWIVAGLRLDAACVRRIGFGDHSELLMQRTKAEVAGTLLTAELALQHGLACNTAGACAAVSSSRRPGQGTHYDHHMSSGPLLPPPIWQCHWHHVTLSLPQPWHAHAGAEGANLCRARML